jgi:rhodanese-related sulfurtransferase
MAADGEGHSQVDATEAERLVRNGAVRILDVRTEPEYRDLGHIPGAILLPVDLIPSAPASLARDGKPLLVCCEHGVRSEFAAGFLARAGYTEVLNLVGGMAGWKGPREYSPWDARVAIGPSTWLVENADLLPRRGRLLDVACGAGRHTLLLAAAEFIVRAVDRDAGKIALLKGTADRLGFAVDASVIDLEAPGMDLGEAAFDAIIGFRYLHRPLFPALGRALKKGGVLIYETFTAAQAASGHPTNPDYLLQPGELERLVAPLEIIRQREGEFDGAQVAAVAARRGA